MAKKRTSVHTWKKPRLDRTTICFTGTLEHSNKTELADYVSSEKGKIANKLSADVDYLVVGDTKSDSPSPTEKRAEKLQQQGAKIEILDEGGFYGLFRPSPEETLEMFAAGKPGWKRWQELARVPWAKFERVDFSWGDLRKLVVSGTDLDNRIDLTGLLIDGADLGGAKLTYAILANVRDARFDGVNLQGSTITRCHHCHFERGDFRNAQAHSLIRCTLDGAKFDGREADSITTFAGETNDTSAKGIQLLGTRVESLDVTRSDFSRSKFRVRAVNAINGPDAHFGEADCREAELAESKFVRADFRAANLTKAKLEKIDFSSADLREAKFEKADLRKAVLKSADLRDADFSDANLADADLRGAKLEGANFEGTNLMGANLEGLDFSKAKNFDPRSTLGGSSGPKMRELAKVARNSAKLQLSIRLDSKPAPILGEIDIVGGTKAPEVHGSSTFGRGESQNEAIEGDTLEDVMLGFVKAWPKAQPLLDTVNVSASKSPMKRKELLDLVTEAWREAFGLDQKAETASEAKPKSTKKKGNVIREEALLELTSGPTGIKGWNSRPGRQRKSVGPLEEQDFSGKDMREVNLSQLTLSRSSFQKADLSGATFAGSTVAGANFTSAKLHQTNLRNGDYSQAKFARADLSEADLSFSNLCGADLTKAKLEGVSWDRTSFDDETKFPRQFAPPDEMVWKGEASDPRIETKIASIQTKKRIPFAEYMQNLRDFVDGKRLQRALDMLEAESYELFSQVDKQEILGVVKSQTSTSTVYSCRLTHDGHFSCCSQSLKPCGGLRGSLCKHLLVLLVGMCRSKKLSPALVYPWILASQYREPLLDEDVMSEAFLRYKSAQAGEVDWRPTVTIPEDFYSL